MHELFIDYILFVNDLCIYISYQRLLFLATVFLRLWRMLLQTQTESNKGKTKEGVGNYIFGISRTSFTIIHKYFYFKAMTVRKSFDDFNSSLSISISLSIAYCITK